MQMPEPTSTIPIDNPISLSIVIPSHCRADLLEQCLTSVVRFAPEQTEAIVVDDGSPGGAISQAASQFPGVKVIRLPRAKGFCCAANAGIAAAKGRIVELLNDDAEVTEGWAKAALSWFADERIAAVAPLILQRDPSRLARGLPPLIDSAGDEYDCGGFAKKRWHGRPVDSIRGFEETGKPGNRLLTAGLVWGASAAAAFYRRDFLIRAGGFPEQFRAYFEDVDLSFRLRKLGGEIAFEPASVVWHRISSSYGKKPSRRVLEQQSCNEERVFWRNISGLARAKFFPRHAAVLTGKAIRRFQEGALLPWLLGRIRALAG